MAGRLTPIYSNGITELSENWYTEYSIITIVPVSLDLLCVFVYIIFSTVTFDIYKTLPKHNQYSFFQHSNLSKDTGLVFFLHLAYHKTGNFCEHNFCLLVCDKFCIKTF